LIADLRLLSLAEAGQLKIEKSLVDVNQMLQHAVDGFRLQSEEQKVQIVVDVEDQIPLIRIDADRMNMVLRNLISNALRYTPENGKIHLQACKKDASVIVEIIDSGTGIAQTDLPFVFDRFYRVDKSRSRASGGTGIGLAVVKQLIEAHGGKVSVTSPVDQYTDGTGYGSLFAIQLPIG
jgi:signal transduction histidine kinase